MNKLHMGVALLSIFAANSAFAQDTPATTLQSTNGKVILTGVLRAADTETYTLETAVGILTIKKSSTVCTGFCPTDALLQSDGQES
ncbi:MAG: hypothetical protein ABI459_02070 [Deltaproteobacteria bacterium]